MHKCKFTYKKASRASAWLPRNDTPTPTPQKARPPKFPVKATPSQYTEQGRGRPPGGARLPQPHLQVVAHTEGVHGLPRVFKLESGFQSYHWVFPGKLSWNKWQIDVIHTICPHRPPTETVTGSRFRWLMISHPLPGLPGPIENLEHVLISVGTKNCIMSNASNVPEFLDRRDTKIIEGLKCEGSGEAPNRSLKIQKLLYRVQE